MRAYEESRPEGRSHINMANGECESNKDARRETRSEKA